MSRKEEKYSFQFGCVLCRCATVAECTACSARDWKEFGRGLLDDPPCFGYASCSEECMLLCPWGEECREAATG